MRNFGILAISILLLLNATICILASLGMILFREEVLPIIQKELETVAEGYELPGSIFEELYDLVSVVIVALALLFLLSAAGILMLKNWARILTVILFAFQLTSSVLLLPYDPLSVTNVLIAALVIWYLLRKDVRDIFKARRLSIEERILGRKD
jgi:hypothetical protein